MSGRRKEKAERKRRGGIRGKKEKKKRGIIEKGKEEKGK